MMSNDNIFELQSWQLPAVDEQLAKINRKADKLGQARVTYQVLRNFQHYAIFDIVSNTLMGWWSEDKPSVVEPGTRVAIRKMVEIEVKGHTVVIDGWRFVAQIEHTQAGNIIRHLDGSPLDTKWRTAKNVCEHCHTNRQRKFTYLLHHENGTVMQVGSTCIEDFLRGHDPSIAVYLATRIRKFTDFLGQGGIPGGNYFSTDEYIPWVALSIREGGWYSRGAAYHNGSHCATADMALNQWSRSLNPYPDETPVFPNEDDYAKAAKALEWARTDLAAIPVHKRSDYHHNLATACSLDYCTHKHAGILASVLVAYDREMAKRAKEALAAERAGNSSSKFLGETGERLRDIEATLTHTWSSDYDDSPYGPRVMNKFETPEGNVIVWWTGREAAEKGDKVLLTGTVKKHDTYKGTKQTILTRCKVTVP